MSINISGTAEVLKLKFSEINKLFNGRNDAIKVVDDYGWVILEAKRKVAEEEPKPELSKTKTRCKKSPLQLREELKIEIKNDEKNINEQIFNIFIDSIILAKQLCSSNQTTNDEIVKHKNDVLIELKKLKGNKSWRWTSWKDSNVVENSSILIKKV